MNSNPKSSSAGSLTPEQYMAERVDDQLAWYGKKSAFNKNWHHRLQLLTLRADLLEEKYRQLLNAQK